MKTAILRRSIDLPVIAPMPNRTITARSNGGRVGRPPLEDEKKEVSKEILFEPSQMEEWLGAARAQATAQGVKMPGVATQMREILMAWARGDLMERASVEREIKAIQIDATAAQNTDSFQAPLLGRVPCGPWQEAVSSTNETFTINKQVADEMHARAGDVFVRASGDSMEEAGIQDEMLVLARPLTPGASPRRGEIALVQVFVDEEESACLATMKRWQGTRGEDVFPTLLKGDGDRFPLPPGTTRVVPVAIAQSVLGRL